MARIGKIILLIILVLACVVLCFLFYYNKAFPEALAIASQMDETDDGYSFKGSSGIGFIIFPGVKADERAYAYLAKLLHDQGHTVIIPKVRFHMAASSEQGIALMDNNPQIDTWYLIGHSAGGMAVNQIALESPDKLEGIVLLASYILEDLSEKDLKALRISASDDGIMNEERMQSNVEYLPKGAVDMVMEGTNHQGFGAYQSISNDGEATMTWQEQQEASIKLILEFIEN